MPSGTETHSILPARPADSQAGYAVSHSPYQAITPRPTLAPLEQAFQSFLSEIHWSLLTGVILVSLLILGMAADWLISAAVSLSERSRIPKVVIGATIVSLGTTTPEVAVSVLAAVRGQSSLALGNAVGSIICNTGLILGLSCLLDPPRIARKIVMRQNAIQLAAVILLVLACFPWPSAGDAFTGGGRVTQWVAFAFLLALAGYVWQSVRWGRERDPVSGDGEESETNSTGVIVARLVGSVALVVVSARILLPAVTESALRLEVPESVIAATLVAFGTSLPELVVAVTAALRGHGELALGNVIGANILNVLFVVGAAGAVTRGGLSADPMFFIVLFPAMLLLMLILRIGLHPGQDRLSRSHGVVMLVIYVAYTVVSYILDGGG